MIPPSSHVWRLEHGHSIHADDGIDPKRRMLDEQGLGTLIRMCEVDCGCRIEVRVDVLTLALTALTLRGAHP